MASANIAGAGGEQLKRPLMVSATAHVCLALALAVGTLLHGKLVVWGAAGGGGAATVQLVSSASVPLPQPAIPTENHVATENPALHYTEPAPKKTIKNPPPDEKAIALPAKNARKAPPPKKLAAVKPEEPPTPRQIASTGNNASPIQPTRRYKEAEQPVTTNEVPYGEGGPAAGPYSMFQSDSGSGGVLVTGDAGDFLSRYSWYVTAIRNRISNNWLKATVDPSIHTAPRVYVTFQILRDGRVVNPQVTASSGLFTLDNSALRAVLDSSPMPPLPADYPNPNVAVEFWFDFRR